ncbi:hypothetical protein FCH33_11145 [Serratia fonticola]|uniref:winged helix-turn-helix domain-containing protein n=1 Tax=Serratia fonticola TaxID=47917 RepID=UPI0015762D70|nr:hypothetical protein [Serratia fonticola]NTZ13008.1 hypothetical protein [Serratia fonticola]
MKTLIKNYSKFENDNIILKDDLFCLKSTNKKVRLTTKQRNLLLCLIGNVNYKNDIMRYLWGDNNSTHENKYNQLVFKLRESLQAVGCPNDAIITMYRYGLCLNNNLLKADVEAERLKMMFLFNAPTRKAMITLA